MKKYNKRILLGIIIASIILILRFLTIDRKKLFTNGEYLFILISQLAIGYIVSALFYYMTIYFPNKNKFLSRLCVNILTL